MFKNCCVCMSKKVIENHTDSETPATKGKDVKGNVDSGNGHTTHLVATSPAVRVNSSISPDGTPEPPLVDQPETVLDREKGSTMDISKGEENKLGICAEIKEDILLLQSCKAKEIPKVEEKKIDICAEIQEEINNLQAAAKLDHVEHIPGCPMSTIQEASSPSERSLGIYSDLYTDEGHPDGNTAACQIPHSQVVDTQSINNSINNDCTAEESDDEESSPTNSNTKEDATPETAFRRTSSGGILKRPSIAWPAEEKPRASARVEVSDDDDVFMAPPACVLAARKQSLPAGLGGGAVGRDELALRRHRVFSELVGAARAAQEHRVRFDPLGPLVASGGDGQTSPHVSPADLEKLLDRLERVVNRLERVADVLPLLPSPPPSPPPAAPADDSTEESGTATPPDSQSPSANSQIDSEDQNPSDKMSVQGYQDIVQGPLSQYISLSNQIGGDVATHAALVQKAFQAQLQYLMLASQSAQPPAAQLQGLLAPTSQQIQAIQEFREKHRTSPLFNHLSAISESIPALGWVAVSPTPAPYVKEMNDAGQFYTNRVLKDWKEKDKKHVEWCKSWVQTLQELQAFVKQQHTTGLVWSGKGSCPPPPPGGMPPPPPCLPEVDFGAADNSGEERNALFAQINQGADITKSLKKVTSDMQTHKNTTLREGPAPFKTPVGAPKPFAKAIPTPGSGQIEKPPVFNRDGKKWLIEYQKGNSGLLVENAEMNNVVYMFKCRDSALTVKGKINSIVLDSCTKCAVVFESLVSSVEFVNCQSVQMQVLGKVPTVSIDKTDGCQMYLSEDSLSVEIVSSKSSEMNVLVPKGNGDYTELPIPEQFKTTLNKANSSLSTIAIESKG